MFKVAVLGSGPAGLIAAHAAASDGRVDIVDIYARGPKSTMYGAQYLHAEVPGVTFDDPVIVKHKRIGTPEGYGEKVYGPGGWGPDIVPLVEDHMAWDIRAAYDWLWLAYSPGIFSTYLDAAQIARIVGRYDLVISSIPAMVLCRYPDHSFLGTQIWAAGEAPEIGIRWDDNPPDNTVVFNGDPTDLWCRKANVFGRTTTEWPENVNVEKIPVTAALVTKPASNDCNCWPNVLRVGRYGTWRKGILSHTAYAAVQERLRAIYEDDQPQEGSGR